MDFAVSLDSTLKNISELETGKGTPAKRIRSEIEFAQKFSKLFPDKKAKWEKMILQAAELVRDKLSVKGPIEIAAVVAEAEEIMSPIGKAAKEYTIHCCGHSHIDMDWMWTWQETISTSHDTYTTVNRLMDEFPEFRFCQSQASIYTAMEEYCPEVFENIRKRIKEGRWDPTASMWVEGDKNMASGEILCRHLLYTRRYFKEHLGLPYDAIKIDWECDTFGHAHTLPTILSRGGVTRYYHVRTGPKKWLFWWEAPDGSRILNFHDKYSYNGRIHAGMADGLVDFIEETGLKEWMYMYGVGDHGGGPTRRDLMQAREMGSWSIYPNLKMSTTDTFFSAVEKAKPDLPVYNQELNFEFDGCYTSQSNVKRANRVSENILPEVEAISVAAGALTGLPYPADDIQRAWRMAMFSQFHDILPGSGIHATYERAQGNFQEIKAIAGTIRTRALRKLAAVVDTSRASGVEPPKGTAGASIGDSFGAGVGDLTMPGAVSAYSMGGLDAEPVLVFNQLGFPRSEVVMAKIWDKEIPADRIAVCDDKGNVTAGQVIETGGFWGHKFVKVAFPAKDVPGIGYKVYTIQRTAVPVQAEGARKADHNVMENEFLRVEVDPASGAIKHLIEKSSGYDYVPEGQLMGVLELCEEVPHGMSAWRIGQIKRLTRLDQDGCLKETQKGPHRCAVKTDRKVGDSRVSVEIGLDAGSWMVDFTVKTRWVERGTPETCIPMLRIAFPTRLADPKATYEIPFGSIQRPVDGREVPALKWADISGDRVSADGACGVTMVNADKYGHSADGNILRLTLIRSSYDPDPLPEMGDHNIRLAIMPHDGSCSVSDATRAGAGFNLPFNIANTDIHKGKLAPSKGFVEVLSKNVMLAAVKKAEDSKAVIVRLYEMEGKNTTAKVRISDIVKPGASAKEVDLLEQPLKASTAKMTGDTLTVKIPAHGIASVMIG